MCDVFPIRFIILLLIVIQQTQQKRYNSVAGPYRIDFKRVEPCSKVEQCDKLQLEDVKQVHSQRRQDLTYSGTVWLPFDINASVGVSISLASWNRVSGWRENAHNIRFDNICLVFDQYFKSLWNRFSRSILGEIRSCPIFAGKYHFENFVVISDDAPVKMFFYGKWRADVHVLVGSKKLDQGCFRIYADTVPA